MPGVARGKRAERIALRKMRGKANAAWTECPACGKRTFSSAESAVSAALGGIAGRRVYWCEQGQGYHLTSKRRPAGGPR